MELECLPKESPSPIQLTQLLEMDHKVLLYLFEAILLERKVILRSRSKAKLSDTSEAARLFESVQRTRQPRENVFFLSGGAEVREVD